jgi:hypothetical protein
MSGNYSPKPPMVIANQPSTTSMIESNSNQLSALLSILKGGVSRKRYRKKTKSRTIKSKKKRTQRRRRHSIICKCNKCKKKHKTRMGGGNSVITGNVGNGLVQIKVPQVTYPETAYPSTSQATANLIETAMQSQANSQYDVVGTGSGSGSGN